MPTLYPLKTKNSFEKSIFTASDYRKNDKCPPWTLQSSKMLHDNQKTIYYDNAILKVYNIPIFYFPKFAIQTRRLNVDQAFASIFSDTRI